MQGLLSSPPARRYVTTSALVCVLTAVSPPDNMWSDYGPLGMLVEKPKQPAVLAADTSQDVYLPYVVNDIASFFTLLVGIYFPSVTGTTLGFTHSSQHVT